MPESSIVFNNYSDTIKIMTQTNRTFSKELEGIGKKVSTLEKTQEAYTKAIGEQKVKVEEARKALKDATKAYRENGDQANALKLNYATQQYEEMTKGLKNLESQSRATQKTIRELGNEASKLETGAEAEIAAGGSVAGGSSDIKGMLQKFLFSGLMNMAGNAVLNISSSLIGSAFGDDTGDLFSSILSDAISGAGIGSSISLGMGTAIGAGVGAVAGFVTGVAKVKEREDTDFKTYVKAAAEAQWAAQEQMLTSGSALAAQRQTDRISFATMFGSDEVARDYLAGLVDMANNTPFLYDDLTAMSKTLATYGYEAGSILPVLQTIGDTGAALGMSTGDMTAVAQALGRMKSSNKTTLEYLNILNDRGVGAVGMLADRFGVDQGTMYKMISEGKVAGEEAVEIILTALTDSFSGSMRRQSRTFSGLTSTVEGLTQELDNAMGEGYNGERTGGLARQRDFLNSGFGTSMEEAYRYMGQWQASLENDKERLERDALESVMTGGVMGSFGEGARKRLEQLHQEYEAALLAESQGDETAGAELGRIFAEAKVLAMNEYNASEGAQLVLEAEKTLIENVRNDTNLKPEYWSAGHELGLEFSKGLAAAISLEDWLKNNSVNEVRPGPGRGNASWDARFGGVNIRQSHAAGLDYVPYDNYPALLHQGERVLTAEQARSADGGRGGVTVHVGTLAVREEADVDRVAQALLERLELAGMRG